MGSRCNQKNWDSSTCWSYAINARPQINKPLLEGAHTMALIVIWWRVSGNFDDFFLENSDLTEEQSPIIEKIKRDKALHRPAKGIREMVLFQSFNELFTRGFKLPWHPSRSTLQLQVGFYDFIGIIGHKTPIKSCKITKSLDTHNFWTTYQNYLKFSQVYDK